MDEAARRAAVEKCYVTERSSRQAVMRIITAEDNKEFYSKLSQLPYLTTLIPISEGLDKELGMIQEQLRSIDHRQIYHHPSYFHITIKEIGWLGEEIEEENLTEIKGKVEEVASTTRPFFLTLRGLNIWPTVIYAEVQEGREQVRQLHLKMRREPRGYTVADSTYEGEMMHPHVTIATFAVGDADRLIQEARLFETRNIGRMKVDKIWLVKTVPHRVSGKSEERASFLEEIASFPLTGAPGP
jgi:2'-5' RNA ligase